MQIRNLFSIISERCGQVSNKTKEVVAEKSERTAGAAVLGPINHVNHTTTYGYKGYLGVGITIGTMSVSNFEVQPGVKVAYMKKDD